MGCPLEPLPLGLLVLLHEILLLLPVELVKPLVPISPTVLSCTLLLEGVRGIVPRLSVGPAMDILIVSLLPGIRPLSSLKSLIRVSVVLILVSVVIGMRVLLWRCFSGCVILSLSFLIGQDLVGLIDLLELLLFAFVQIGVVLLHQGPIARLYAIERGRFVHFQYLVVILGGVVVLHCKSVAIFQCQEHTIIPTEG